jgi:hypothetical protein
VVHVLDDVENEGIPTQLQNAVNKIPDAFKNYKKKSFLILKNLIYIS